MKQYTFETKRKNRKSEIIIKREKYYINYKKIYVI